MARLHFRGHIGKRDYAVNTVPPTISGSAISGQTLTRGAGTWTTVESTNTGFAYVWQSADAPLFENWTDISGATNTTLLLSGTHIGKKIRVGEARVNGDGQAPFVYSQPTLVVQDAPAVPLSVTGTPVTTANQGSPANFIVSFDGGSGTYTPSLLNAPSGSSVAMLSNGDQAEVTLNTANVGSFGNIIVRVSDGVVTADLAPFTFTVNAIGSIPKLVPGTGWSGTTAAPAPRGAPGKVGYEYQCNLWWANEQYETIAGQKVLELVAGHTGEKTDWQADGTPLYGMYSVEASLDNGPWVLIAPTYDSTNNRYGYRFIVDANDFADGVWSTTRREVRVRGVGKNGQGRVLQGDDYNWPGYHFSTNRDGTLPTLIKYCASSGDDTTGDGSSGNPYRQPGRAATALGSGGGVVKLKAGSYTMGGVSSFTDNGRWLTIQADDGLNRSEVTINATGTWVVQRTKLKSLTTSKPLPVPANGAICFDNCVCDQGAAYVRVLDNAPYVYSGGTKRAYFVDSYITNWAYGGDGVRLYRNCQIGTIASDVFRSTHCALNCTLDTVLSGQRETSPGVWDGGGNYHPDFMQPFRAGGSYHWGGMMYNITANTGNMDAQGPFFKDADEHIGFFLINMDIVLKGDNRNMLFLSGTETLRNSMFYNTAFTNGIRAWSGSCDSVVAINMTLASMAAGANSVPGQILNYTP